MNRRLPVADLTHAHVGAYVEARPSTDEGPLTISGLIRWFTVTSDEVIVAVEEVEDDGAVEWTFPVDAELALIRDNR